MMIVGNYNGGIEKTQNYSRRREKMMKKATIMEEYLRKHRTTVEEGRR